MTYVDQFAKAAATDMRGKATEFMRFALATGVAAVTGEMDPVKYYQARWPLSKRLDVIRKTAGARLDDRVGMISFPKCRICRRRSWICCDRKPCSVE